MSLSAASGVPVDTVQAASMTARMKRAAALLLGSSVAAQALRLLSSLVLTRLLVPEAFGLVAALQTIYLGLLLFSDLGVWQSVVNSRHADDPRFLGTALSVQLARGLLLAVLVGLVALCLQLASSGQLPGFGGQRLAGVYADPRLPAMLLAFTLVAMLQGFESMNLASAQRRLQTGLLARLELVSQLLGVLLTLALAWLTRSVWSLVIGALLAAFARTLLSHLWLPGRWVKPCWQADHARQIIGFGKWIFLSSIVGFAAAHGEKLLLGGLMPTAEFGIFVIAATLLAAVTGLVGSLNAHLIFPSLSEALRRSPAEAQQVYQRLQRLADLLLGVVAGLLFALGHWAVWLLYDTRYQAAGWMLQWLALGLPGLRYQVLEQLMFARGAPGWVTLANTLRAVFMVLAVPLGHQWAQVPGAIAAVALAQYAGWPVALLYQWRQRRADRLTPARSAHASAASVPASPKFSPAVFVSPQRSPWQAIWQPVWRLLCRFACLPALALGMLAGSALSAGLHWLQRSLA